jgi:hypothetical protein
MTPMTTPTARQVNKPVPTDVNTRENRDMPQQSTRDLLRSPAMRTALPFLNGGAAGMIATTLIQPVDMIKVRLQLVGEGVKTSSRATALTIVRDIVATGRAKDLYTGLSAGLLRQAVYTTARLGIFDTLMNVLAKRAEAHSAKIGFKERALAGLAAGGLGAFVGNPADLALIRMQSDGLHPASDRANFRGVGDALILQSRNAADVYTTWLFGVQSQQSLYSWLETNVYLRIVSKSNADSSTLSQKHSKSQVERLRFPHRLNA